MLIYIWVKVTKSVRPVRDEKNIYKANYTEDPTFGRIVTPFILITYMMFQLNNVIFCSMSGDFKIIEAFSTFCSIFAQF